MKAESRISGKLQQAHQTSIWGKKETRMLMSCQISITWPQMQIPLNVTHSCTFLKTPRQWSRWSTKDEVQWWDTYPERTESRQIGQNQLGPQDSNQICWHQKPTTKGSSTRDEWCNLLRLFNIMNFSMFSRSHFRSVEKATVMSKRIQERKTEGEPAVAKPKSVCLSSRNQNKGQTSSSGADAATVLVNPQLGSGSVQRSFQETVAKKLQKIAAQVLLNGWRTSQRI